MRIGLGYDLHRLVKGRKLILGGVEIPFGYGLLGHSDADVLLHSISDALLGSVAMGDIGLLFPDTDPENKNLDSSIILKKSIEILNKKGYELNNIDSVIIAEEPKLSGYYEKMRGKIARLLNIGKNAVSVKAKTKEKTERKIKTIEVYSVVLVIKSK